MQVIEHEPQWWFLLEHEGSLFLDVNCSHSAISYNFLLQLNAEESAAYQLQGKPLLERIAQAIQDSAPILIISTSIYKQRNASQHYGQQVTAAIQEWQQSQTKSSAS